MAWFKRTPFVDSTTSPQEFSNLVQVSSNQISSDSLQKLAFKKSQNPTGPCFYISTRRF